MRTRIVLDWLIASVFIIGMVVLCGCDKDVNDVRWEKVDQCTAKQNEKLAPWVNECIKNANPKSDEEPEDWIYMCKNMGKEMFCTEVSKPYLYSSRRFYCEDLVSGHKFYLACKAVGAYD